MPHHGVPALVLGAVVGVALCGCESRPEPVGPEPSRSRAAGLEAPREPWSYQGSPGVVIRTRHYRIFTTETDEAMLARLPVFLEAALANYTSALAPLPPPSDRLDSYFMATRWQWDRLTRQLMGDNAALFLRIQRGGYAFGGRGVFYNIGLRDTLAIGSHEGWHQYTQRVLTQPLPIWLEEGIACVMEGFRTGADGSYTFAAWANVERFDQLRASSANGSLLSLRELLTTSPQSTEDASTDRILTYYAQAWALVHFLREGEGGRHAPRLAELLTDAARGRLVANVAFRTRGSAPIDAPATRLGDAVFRAYFDPDIEAASRSYSEFISRLVRPGAKDLVVQGISPVKTISP